MPVLRRQPGGLLWAPWSDSFRLHPFLKELGGPRTWLYPSFPQEVANLPGWERGLQAVAS